MRLLELDDNGCGEPRLVDFSARELIPPYAILSHTWGTPEQEVSFKDLADGTAATKDGYRKIRFCAERAAADNLRHFWIDTCCIDKTNSVELNESIISMFRWYQNARVCYVYLSDLSTAYDQASSAWSKALRSCRWFSRGWTLQELLAPSSVSFFSSSGQLLGDKKSLEREIHELTGIAVAALRGTALSTFSIENRMSWARDRQTTREEDQAYCLLGIFGVFLLPMYGEGRENALERLEREIHRRLSASDSTASFHLSTDFPSVDSSSNITKSLQRNSGPGPNSSAKAEDVDDYIAGLADMTSDWFEQFKSNTHSRSARAKIIAQLEGQRRYLENLNRATRLDETNADGKYWKYSAAAEQLSRILEILRVERIKYAAQVSQHLETSWTRYRRTTAEQAKHRAQADILARHIQALDDLVSSDVPAVSELAHDNHLAPTSTLNCTQSGSATVTTIPMAEIIDQCSRQIQDELEAGMRRTLHGWIIGQHTHIPPVNEQCDKFNKIRLDGTCDWILDRAEFRSWISPDFTAQTAKAMWINGHAGFGKTILSARIIQHLQTTHKQLVASFFLTSDFSSQDDPIVTIRSWISQLLSNQHVCEVVYNRWASQSAQSATEAGILELFREIVQVIPGLIFIVDGLDECAWMKSSWKSADRKPISVFLEKLWGAIADTHSRLLIVSRDEPDIRYGLLQIKPEAFWEYKISPDDNRLDLERFSRKIVNTKLFKKPEAAQNHISQRLASHCDGQFLLLKLQGDSLESWMSKKELEDTIDETPRGLNDLYDRYWNEMLAFPSRKRNRAMAVLRWAAFAIRPLTVCEIAEALIIREDDDDLPVDELPDSFDDAYIKCSIKDLCSSLIEIRDVTVVQDADPRFRTVHLAHFSVKEYCLRQYAQASGPGLEDRLDLIEQRQHTLLAKLCLCYVNFSNVWQEEYNGDRVLARKPATRPFRNYATLSWYEHVNRGQPSDLEVVGIINAFFDAQNPRWASWRMSYDACRKGLADGTAQYGKEGDYTSDPICYAAQLGLVGTLEYLLQIHSEKSTLNTDKINMALRFACEKNFSTIAAMLLDHGADVNGVLWDNDHTPLLAVAANGNVGLLTLLLDKGADVTSRDRSGWTPLSFAAANGHTEIVRLLLSKGSDPTTANRQGYTPLSSASQFGYVEIVKLLLAEVADVNKPKGGRGAPLNVAARNGRTEVIQLLVDRGANLHMRDDGGYTPLCSAACNGFASAVRVLLDSGADLTIANTRGWTPLNAASTNGHLEVVQMLLAEGADVSTANNNGWTPLLCACGNGYTEIVEVLLDKGADVTVKAGGGYSALFFAAQKGFTAIVQMLLQHGANIEIGADEDNGSKTSGWTPLAAACAEGQVKTVQALLDAGADATAASLQGHTPLYLAASNGRMDVVRLLLGLRANARVVYVPGFTPMDAIIALG